MWFLFKLINLVYFLTSSYIWWSFSLPGNAFLVIVFVLLIGTLILAKVPLEFTRRSTQLFFLLVILTGWGWYILGPSFGFLTFFSYFPAVLLFCLPEWEKGNLLHFITKWYGVMMAIALVVYVLVFLGMMPSFGKFVAGDMDYPPYDNFIFWVQTPMYSGEHLRFNGPFLEPGHQSMISTFILFANGYDFKRRPLLWVLLACVLISLSLAGYVLCGLGYAVLKIKSVKPLLYTLIGGTAFFFIVTDLWNGGDNPVNTAIFSRLEVDKDKGIKGNNRTFGNTDSYFQEAIGSEIFWLGVGNQEVDKKNIGGAGFKIFILRYGVIFLAIVTLFYLSLMTPGANKRVAWGFFLLIAAAFLQRGYPSWYSWLLPYVLTIGCSVRPLEEPETILTDENLIEG